MDKRPTGIGIIATIFIILGIVSFLWSGLVLGFGGVRTLLGGLIGAEQMAAAGASGAWSGFLGILTGVVQIVTGFGLLAMKKWAWILAIIAVGLSVLQGIIGMFNGGIFGFMCGGIGLIIPVILLVYLLSANIRRRFDISPGS
jgi:hypothetical protein